MSSFLTLTYFQPSILKLSDDICIPKSLQNKYVLNVNAMDKSLFEENFLQYQKLMMVKLTYLLIIVHLIMMHYCQKVEVLISLMYQESILYQMITMMIIQQHNLQRKLLLYRKLMVMALLNLGPARTFISIQLFIIG